MKRRGFLKTLGALALSGVIAKEASAKTVPAEVVEPVGTPLQKRPVTDHRFITRTYTGNGGSQYIYMGETPQSVTIKREMSEEIGTKLGEELDRQVLQAFADTKPFYQKINKDLSWLKK